MIKPAFFRSRILMLLLNLFVISACFAQTNYILTSRDSSTYFQITFKKINDTVGVRYLINGLDTVLFKDYKLKPVKKQLESDSMTALYAHIRPLIKDSTFIKWLSNKISDRNDSFNVLSLYKLNDSLWYKKGNGITMNIALGDIVYRDSLMKKTFANGKVTNLFQADSSGIVINTIIPPPPPPPPSNPVNWFMYFIFAAVAIFLLLVWISILIYQKQNQKKPADIESLNKEIDRLKTRKKHYKTESGKLEAKNIELQSNLNKSNESLNKVKAQLKDFDKNKQEEISGINANHQKEITSLKEGHASHIKKLEDTHKELVKKFEEKNKQDHERFQKEKEELLVIFKSIAELNKKMENEIFQHAGAVSNKELMTMLLSFLLRISFLSGGASRYLIQGEHTSESDKRNVNLLLQHPSSSLRIISVHDEPNKMDPILFAVVQLLKHFDMEELEGVAINGFEITSKK
jgi:hypothetical protein